MRRHRVPTLPWAASAGEAAFLPLNSPRGFAFTETSGKSVKASLRLVTGGGGPRALTAAECVCPVSKTSGASEAVREGRHHEATDAPVGVASVPPHFPDSSPGRSGTAFPAGTKGTGLEAGAPRRP